MLYPFFVKQSQAKGDRGFPQGNNCFPSGSHGDQTASKKGYLLRRKRMIVTPEGLLHLPAGASVTMKK